MKQKFITLLFLAIFSNVFSQDDKDFQYITSSTKGDLIYVLFEKENNGTKEFWLKINEPFKSIKSKKGKMIKSGGGYSLQYIKMDCEEKEYSSTDGVIYDKNGNPKQRPEYYNVYQEKIIPGSIMTAVYKYICEYY